MDPILRSQNGKRRRRKILKPLTSVSSVGDAIRRSEGIFSGFSIRQTPLWLAAVECALYSSGCGRGIREPFRLGAVTDLLATSVLITG